MGINTDYIPKALHVTGLFVQQQYSLFNQS